MRVRNFLVLFHSFLGARLNIRIRKWEQRKLFHFFGRKIALKKGDEKTMAAKKKVTKKKRTVKRGKAKKR